MCGIFGIVSTDEETNIYNLILNGLVQLQNRGYDSAGFAVIEKDKFLIHKHASDNKETALDKLSRIISDPSFIVKPDIPIGIGHNRWATHGIQNDTNAHPHISNTKKFIIVHNGIIENYNELKEELVRNGISFYSQTDTEVIVNYVEYVYSTKHNIMDALRTTIKKLQGTYGIILYSLYEPTKLYCVRNGSPLLVGQDENCVIITSEQSGFCNIVKNYITLDKDDICIIEKQQNKIAVSTNNNYLKKATTEFNNTLTPYPYEHWTLKEINEQPAVVLNSINNGGRIKNNSEVKLGGLERFTDVFKRVDNIIILGCGTSYFAGLYGMHFFKNLCNFNTVQVFDGAEFAHYDIPKIGMTVFILISQSGETKDLHRCIEIARQNNIMSIGIINVVDSLIAREVDCGIYCNAGKEVGVASTKSFTSQVVCLSLAAIWFAQINGLNENKRIKMIRDLHNLSHDIKNTISQCSDVIRMISQKMVHSTTINQGNMFLLGKGTDEYVAKEGSLKIKEISYIHSEGYSSSSLKHGPFALLDESFPVVIFNLDQTHKTKIVNCCQEVSSRKSPILFITNDVNTEDLFFERIVIPENNSYCSLLGIIPVQLLAYNLSVNKGINPDKPKNLAKVVTVE